jgi:SOS response associated peptidase (SRAP)
MRFAASPEIASHDPQQLCTPPTATHCTRFLGAVIGRPIYHNLPMCGRYRLPRRKQLIEEYFASVFRGNEDFSPRYNIASTQPVPVIRQNPKEPVRELSLLRWDSFHHMGPRLVWFRQGDQCKVGKREHKACVPRCVEISHMPHSGRCVL